MRIAVVCCGTAGEVWVACAMGMGLLRRGQEVVILAPEEYRLTIEQRYGLKWAPLTFAATSHDYPREQCDRDWQWRVMRDKQTNRDWPQALKDLEHILSTAEGVIVTQTQPILSAVYCLAEKYGLPLLGLFTVPLSVTSSTCSTLTADSPLYNNTHTSRVPLLNKFSHLSALRAEWTKSLQGLIEPYRHKLGLPPLASPFGVVPLFKPQGLSIIYPMTSVVLERPPDWGYFLVKITGFLTPRPQAQKASGTSRLYHEQSTKNSIWDYSLGLFHGKPEEAVAKDTAAIADEDAQRKSDWRVAQAFLGIQSETTPTPASSSTSTSTATTPTTTTTTTLKPEEKAVLFAAGSLPVSDPKLLVALAGRVAREAKRRVIVIAGRWAEEIDKSDIDADSVCVVSYLAYERILPHCICFVHHGGYIPSVACLRAGVPAVVIARTPEQYYWGHALHRVGIAPPPLRFSTPAALASADSAFAQAISAAVGATAVAKQQQQAQSVRNKLRNSENAGDGLDKACEAVERQTVISIGCLPTQQVARSVSGVSVLMLELNQTEKALLAALLLLPLLLILLVYLLA
eukprot:TRINITY_DN3087_c0_g5_i1.p1 TRINITY_DN3087_c0_g5~~TRINITY_DN3087_c0_g5_i1.p1  ORF type:complete len:572 (+),score=110.28 TRINITY_DN3087_c0_g5_i1:1356-3071(+)